jgi:hypothetical protein
MNKLSSPDAEVKQQHTWLSSKLGYSNRRELLFLLFSLSNLGFNGINPES